MSTNYSSALMREADLLRIVCIASSNLNFPAGYADWPIDYCVGFEDWKSDKSGNIIFVIGECASTNW